MFTKSKIAILAALATTLGTPAFAAHAAHAAKTEQQATGAYASFVSSGRPQVSTTVPTGGHDWQRDGRLPLTYPYSGD